MAFKQKPGQGTLFKNDRKQKDTHPDYTGTINIDGVDHWLSAWIKQGQKGAFMSLSVGDPKQQQSGQAQGYDGNKDLPAAGGGGFPQDDDGGDIPFAPLRELP